MIKFRYWFVLLLLITAVRSTSLLLAETTQPTATQLMDEFGYGVSVLPWTAEGMPGFQWKKVYLPPSVRLPNHILYRMPYTAYDHLDLAGFAARVQRLTQKYGDFIEAYEIGNEVNLYRTGWEGFPRANEYAELLCVAYSEIKHNDPNAIVVSAGLAPVGRIVGNWNGHAGHNGQVQDEREFMREFLAAGGAECADVIGYHPIGFRANFDAEPDVDGGTPETNCINGFCFRGVEKIRDILVEYGYAEKKIWATEMGWLVAPAYDGCLSYINWQGRGWQIVSPEAQAENILGAFQYTEANWPWLGAMFVFNYNFNEYHPWWTCQHMGSYGIKGGLAERTLLEWHLPQRTYLPTVARRSYLP